MKQFLDVYMAGGFENSPIVDQKFMIQENKSFKQILEDSDSVLVQMFLHLDYAAFLKTINRESIRHLMLIQSHTAGVSYCPEQSCMFCFFFKAEP